MNFSPLVDPADIWWLHSFYNDNDNMYLQGFVAWPFFKAQKLSANHSLYEVCMYVVFCLHSTHVYSMTKYWLKCTLEIIQSILQQSADIH